MRQLTFIILLFSISTTIIAQKSQSIDFEKQYESRIKKSKINGIYIPYDLGDCFVQLNKLISREAKGQFKAAPEQVVAKKLHYSLGRWIWHNWGFYGGSRLSVYLNKVGIDHPEDMSTFLIITYHRYLNKKPIKVKELAEEIRAKRDKLRKKKSEPTQHR